MGSMTPEFLVQSELRVTRETISQYAALTDDYNPIHVDEEFALASPMGGIIAHGTMALNLIFNSFERTFDRHFLRYLTVDIRFLHPVRPGDLLRAGGELTEPSLFNVWVKSDKGTVVIAGKADISQ